MEDTEATEPLMSGKSALELKDSKHSSNTEDDGSLQGFKDFPALVEKLELAGLEDMTSHFEVNVEKGHRVVRGRDWDKNKDEDGGEGNVGTVIHIKSSIDKFKTDGDTSHSTIRVKWDAQKAECEYTLGDGKSPLRLFDTSQTEFEEPHENILCNECNMFPINGMKFTCLQCKNVDFCAACYGNADHDIRHKFKRKLSPKSPSIHIGMRKGLRRLTAFGIFRSNSVKVRNQDEKGIVKENPKKGKVIVCMKRTKKEKDFKITELQCRPNVSQWPRVQYFPDHLPNLGREDSGLLKLRYKDGKVYVKIWYIRNERDSQKKGRKHADIVIDRGLQMSVSVAGKWCGNVIDEVQTFSRKTQLPCHLIEKKLLIFQDTAFIHKDTDVHDIKKLLELEISVLQIGENEDNEDDINYFRRLIEYFCGKNCMPVIISLNDGFKKDSRNDCIRHYPVLAFKYKDVVDVFTFNGEEKDERKITIHSFCTERPWVRTLKTEFNSLSEIISHYLEKNHCWMFYLSANIWTSLYAI